MKTSIYVGSSRIEAIGYIGATDAVTIKEYLCVELPEGAVINGKITDSAQVVEQLTALKNQNPKMFADTNLVIDGNSLIIKRLTAPKLKKQQYYQLVRDFFKDSGDIGRMVFDYSHLSEKKEKQTVLLACATEKSYLKSYLRAFREAGIALSGASVGLEALIDYIKTQKTLSGKTFVVNIVDGVSMLSVLFEKGSYIFSNRTRIVGEDLGQYLGSVIESLSSMIQFNQSQRLSSIGASYYVGLSAAQLELLAHLNTHTEIEISPLGLLDRCKNSGCITSPCHFSALGMMRGKGSMNLIQSLRNLEKHKAESTRRNPFVMVVAVQLAVCLALFAYPVWNILRLNGEIKQINAHLSEAEYQKTLAEANAAVERAAKLNERIDLIEGKKDELAMLPAVGDEVLQIIISSNWQNVSITGVGFDETTGVLRVQGSAATEKDSAEYVRVLKESGMIYDVSYTGYNYDGTPPNRFNFIMEIVTLTQKQEAAYEN